MPPERAGTDADCLVLYRRRADVGGEDYVVQLTFSEKTLDEAAVAAGFQRREGGWFMPDRFEGAEGTTIAGRGWTGVQATNVCSTEDEAGFHAAGGECLTAVLSRGRRSVVLVHQHSGTGEFPEPAVVSLIESVRFATMPR